MYIKGSGIRRAPKKGKNGMKKYNSKAESVINLKNDDYGRLHVSNYRAGWDNYKKYYVYRVNLKTCDIVESKPFIMDLDAFRLEMDRRGVSLWFD